MKPYYQLTDEERLKLSQIGLLWELYPEADAASFLIPPDQEKCDDPEMVAFLEEVGRSYTLERFYADISAIELAWEIKRRNQTLSNEFDKLFQK